VRGLARVLCAKRHPHTSSAGTDAAGRYRESAASGGGAIIAGPWSEFQRPRELPLSRIRQRGHAVCSTVVNGLAPAAESPPGPLLRAAVEAAARFMSASGAAASRRGCLVVLLYYRTLLGWVKSLIRGRMFVVLATFP